MPYDGCALAEPVETSTRHATESPARAGEGDGGAGQEGATALRNGVKLATSLVLTWGVALVITFTLPKYLGPLQWGYYKFGFEYAAFLAVFVGFGIDTYVSREVAVRPQHASDFFGGVLALRTLGLLPLLAYAWFDLDDNDHAEKLAAAFFGVAQIFVVLNQTFQQMLQAASRVGGLAVANVVSKILWGGGTFAAVMLRAPFWVLPLPMLASESLKALFLHRATREAIDLRIRLDAAETAKVLRIAFPFFIANAAVMLGSTIDVVVLRKLVPSGSEEVGWYSAGREIARLSALMSPVLSGVLVPMMSRARVRNEEEFYRLLRRGLEGVSVVAIPLTLILALSAETVIGITLKAKFLPAAMSLEWLAPTFVLAYANVLLWIALMILERSWTITIISIAGLGLLYLFIHVFVPLTRGMGPGAYGMGVAMALTAREAVIVGVFLAILGKKAIDRRSLAAITKSLGACCAVIAFHVLLPELGAARVLLDGLVYVAVALAIRVVRIGDLKAVLTMIKNRKNPQPA